MTENGLPTQAPERTGGGQEPFRAILTPHRSLGPRGFLTLMAALSIVGFITGVAFLSVGAWPVFGFFGLDILIVYIAFRLNYRAGRIQEAIEITADHIHLTRLHPSGRAERFTFNPYWTRVELDEGRDGRTALNLRHHDRVIGFGRFLNDDERREVAPMLRKALATVRGGTSF